QFIPAGQRMPAMPPQWITLGSPMQMPPQSAPPLLGSQLSLGSSTQLWPAVQGKPPNPPQWVTVGSGTQVARGGQGARTQTTSSTLHTDPTGQRTAAQGLVVSQSWTLSRL